MATNDELLALADELEAVSLKDDCDACFASGTGLCRGDIECAESAHKACAKRLREIVERDECEVTTVSAYDLLSEEDRKALAWVREYGGLEAVRASIHQGAMGHGCLLKVAEMLGTSIYDGTGNADALLDKLEKRLMPEGMEWLLEVWPKWSNGEYCKFGDWWTAAKYGDYEPKQLRRLGFYTPEQLKEWEQDEGDNYGYEWDFMRPSDTNYRPDKAETPASKVLAADGEPLEARQTVYDVEDGKTHHVTEVDAVSKRFRSMEQIDGSHWLDPMLFTHQRPVLDADGVPIHEGDTVYEVGENYPPFIVGGLPKPDAYRSVRVVYPSGAFTYLDPERLTHAKLEQDTWERIERGIERGKTYTDELVLSIVRRCKALAERGA